FLAVTCEKCGTVLKPELQSIFVYAGLKILLIPEKDADSFLLGNLNIPGTDRVVIGFRELVEKIRILKDGLDDKIIEIVKFYILQKLDSENEIIIEFHQFENNELVFHIFGLKQDEIGISKLPADFYENVKKSYKTLKNEEPFTFILEGPYISLNKIEWENEQE
ncbi:MAG: hypothetical protein JW874_08710, partial [Spirochaetales bacterium]|nr:hypothetical protein [Spirochaetales bacterium]